MSHHTLGPNNFDHHNHSHISHPYSPQMHPQVVKTGNAIDCVMGVARRSPFIQEKNHNLEALYTNIIQQAIYFIQQYKMLSYDAQVQNLKSKELESIIDLADRLPQKTHNIPSANRDNLLFIISHLDLVLKDQPFGDHDTASLVIECGTRYIHTLSCPNPMDSCSLRECLNKVRELCRNRRYDNETPDNGTTT